MCVRSILPADLKLSSDTSENQGLCIITKFELSMKKFSKS